MTFFSEDAPSCILNTVFLSKPQSCRFQPSSFWKTSAIGPQKPLVPRAPQPGGCGCLLGKWRPLPVILFLNSGSRTDRQSAPGCGRPTPWGVSHPPRPEARRLSAPHSVGLLAGGISPRPESRSGEPSAPGRSSCQVGAGTTPPTWSPCCSTGRVVASTGVARVSPIAQPVSPPV